MIWKVTFKGKGDKCSTTIRVASDISNETLFKDWFSLNYSNFTLLTATLINE